MGKRKKKRPELVFRDGEATAVILDIHEYRDMLERLEDIEDLKLLQNMRQKPLRFRKLDDFLKERSSPTSQRVVPMNFQLAMQPVFPP